MKVIKINNLAFGAQHPEPSTQNQVPNSNNVTIQQCNNLAMKQNPVPRTQNLKLSSNNPPVVGQVLTM